ncbi:MAG TPA: hypothetical protein VHR43_07960 [Gemmatimonadales bacterium]|jgi:hypothetical protein|nr:hypothetical protein [Gemmatimonadales bacterium]
MAGDNRRLALNVHKSSRSTVPTVHIFLQRMIRQDNGMLAVTPVCSTLAEIEAEVEGLQSELLHILAEARQAYGPKRGPASLA